MIGHHLLEGKLVNLAKPLAVLHKHGSPPGTDDTAMEVEVEDGSPRPAAHAKSWDIVAVVKKKMVFAKRPLPVVGHSTGKGSSAVPLSRIGSKAG